MYSLVLYTLDALSGYFGRSSGVGGIFEALLFWLSYFGFGLILFPILVVITFYYLNKKILESLDDIAWRKSTEAPSFDYEGSPYDKDIFVKGDIEVATIQDFTTQSSFETLAQVKFQALIQGFQPKNSSCLTC